MQYRILTGPQEGIAILVVGALSLAAGGILDLFFRLRMTRAGYKIAMLQGGAFNYREYHNVRQKYGWSALPVYVMWFLILAGLILIVLGVGMRYGWSHHARV